MASSHTPDLVRASRLALKRAFVAADDRGRPYEYRKAGVVLGELGTEQGALFGEEKPPEWTEAQRRLMAAADAVNGRFGKRAVVVAAQGPPSALRKARDGSEGAPRWEMRRERMSPRYTTRIDEVAVVRA